MQAVAMIIWLGVTPAQVQNVQAQDPHTRRQNLLQQQREQLQPPPPRQSNELPNSMR